MKLGLRHTRRDDWGNLKGDPYSVIGAGRSSEAVAYGSFDSKGHHFVSGERQIVLVVSCGVVGFEGEEDICDLGA